MSRLHSVNGDGILKVSSTHKRRSRETFEQGVAGSLSDEMFLMKAENPAVPIRRATWVFSGRLEHLKQEVSALP